MASNLRAFLDTIAACEGTDGPAGYRTLYGGGQFDPDKTLPDHPRRSVTAGGYTSTAAGRYQILAGTWDDFIKATYPRPFDEAGQDACAAWLIDRRGATQDVQDGRLGDAIQKCSKEWASLPGSPYGQPTRTLRYCLDKFIAAGGVPANDYQLATAPDSGTTVPESSTSPKGSTMWPLLLPGILQMIPQLVGAFSKGGKAEGNQKLAQTVVDVFTAAVPGAVNAQQAVEMAAADPALKAAATTAVLTNPVVEQLLSIGPTDIAGARAANLALVQATTKPWTVIFNPVLLVTFATLPLVYLIVLKLVAFMDKVSSDVIAQTIGTVIGLVLGGVMGFWMGQTYQANVKRTTDQPPV